MKAGRTPAIPVQMHAAAPATVDRSSRRAAGAGLVFEDLARRANVAVELLQAALAADDVDSVEAALSVCQHMGWLADRAATAHGGASCREGDPGAWLLSPAVAAVLARAERESSTGAGQP